MLTIYPPNAYASVAERGRCRDVDNIVADQYGTQHLGCMILCDIENHCSFFVPVICQRAQPDLIYGCERSLI